MVYDYPTQHPSDTHALSEQPREAAQNLRNIRTHSTRSIYVNKFGIVDIDGAGCMLLSSSHTGQTWVEFGAKKAAQGWPLIGFSGLLLHGTREKQ